MTWRAGGPDRGQSTVEFALVLPLILLLLLGLLQVGLLLKDQLLVAAAAREGAREAAVTPDATRIEAAAGRAAPGLVLDVEIVRGPHRGDTTTVTVSSSPHALPIVGGLVSGREVSARATMRVERSASGS